MIEKFNYITPGREADDQDVKLINRKNTNRRWLPKQAGKDANDPYIARATAYLDLLGGPSNITELSSCATRLRVSVADQVRLHQMQTLKQIKLLMLFTMVRHYKLL